MKTEVPQVVFDCENIQLHVVSLWLVNGWPLWPSMGAILTG